MSQIIKNQAFNFFIQQGGKVEDWGENEETNAVEEMLKRWRDSEWGSILRRRKKQSRRQMSRWVGVSFEIGDVVGVNILGEPAESIRERISSRSNLPSRKVSSSPSQTQIHGEEAPHSFATESYVTAHTEPTPALSISPDPEYYTPSQEHRNLYSPNTTAGPIPSSPTSSTALLRPSLRNGVFQKKALSEVHHRPTIKMPSTTMKTDGNINVKTTGKGKIVHYSNSPAAEQEEPVAASPSEVLERTGSAIADTSAAATATTNSQPDIDWGDVVMRGIGIPFILSHFRYDMKYRPNAC
jgi:hypothetical protein